jgi:hypothetical protein
MMKDEAFKVACLNAAVTVWASGKLDQAWGAASTPEDMVKRITDFAAMLYTARPRKQAACVNPRA